MTFGNGDRRNQGPVVAPGADIVGRGAFYQLKGVSVPSAVGFEVGHIARVNFGHCVVSLSWK